MNRKILTACLLTLSLAAVGARAADEPAKTDTYPLTTCVVSGEGLDEMGDPVIYTNTAGREIRFCCKKCIKKYEADPAKYLSKLDEAAKAQAEGKKDTKAEGHEHHD